MKASPHQIAAFTEAFRQRSISRAAVTLNVTQSAVTQHLAKLEHAMGTRLFMRSRSGLEPTRAALDLFVLTDRMRILDQLIAEKIDAYGALESGQLTIIANAPRPAMLLIAGFVRRFPHVRIVFSLVSWTLAKQKLEAREVDIAIVTEPEAREGFHCQHLSSGRFLAVMPEDHPLAAKAQIRFADLRTVTTILPEEGSLTQRIVTDRMRELGLSLERVVEMTTFPVVKEAVLHGIGVGILFEDSVAEADGLVLRPILELDRKFQTYLVTPEDKRDLHLVRSFIETIP